MMPPGRLPGVAFLGALFADNYASGKK